jgi:tetratricopeptide (TPR) repeat protein
VCPQHGAPRLAASASEPPLPVEFFPPELPEYRIGSLLGLGGFGAVFRAERRRDGLAVAIKVARADQLTASERLLLEAEALRAIGPPQVPEVYAVGHLPDGAAFMVLEYVRAPTLAAVLTEVRGPLFSEQFRRIALALVDLVAAVHKKGFVHCDLKPENVFVAPERSDLGFVAKLFDFGLVRKRIEPSETTREEAPEGTPEYMSPEQCEGDRDIDARSDVYAIGVMLYEMATGAPPFWGNSAEIQQSHRSHRPPSPSRRAPLSAVLESLILKCLAKSPGRRFADGTELAQATRAAFGKARTAEPTPGRTAPIPVASPASAAGEDASAKTKVPVAAVRERRAVAMVFFETKSPVAAVRDIIAAIGGQLAHTAGMQYVIALGHEVGDNPTRSAAQAAQLLLDRGVCSRALVDLATVSIQVRPDGMRRYQSPLFARKEQYPSESDPLGVMVSKAATDVLPEVEAVSLTGKPGFSIVSRTEDAPETTAMRAGVAPLVGREEILRRLLDSARAVAATTSPTTVDLGKLGGRPTIVTIMGTPGAGKTHLAAALAQHLQSVLPPMRVLLLRAKEVLGGAGDQTTRELLRHGMGLPTEAPADLGRAIVVEHLGREASREVWAAVAVVMGWVSPDHRDVAWLSAAPGALRAAAARAVGEALRRLSRQAGALALILDDAHFADETVLDAIEYATLQEAGYPIWVAVLGRPAFGKGRTAWASRAAERLNLELGPLEPTAAAELARRLLSPAENVSAEALRRLTERTQGIPLLLVELVRGLKRDGLVRKSEKTGAWFLATDELERLPDLPLVQWLASRETESLPPELAGHARLASVLGPEFTAEELEGVMQWLEREGETPETQLDAAVGIDRLTDAGVLVRHREGRVGFRHSLLREAVYRTVSPAQRESTHRAAYGFYAEHTALPEDRRLPAMALHAARSGLKNEAANTYLDLAQKAERRHSYLDAELLFDSAIQNLLGVPEALRNDGRQIRARQGLGTMRFRLGRYEDALQELSTAREAAHVAAVRESEIDLLLEESLVLDWLKDWTKAAQLAELAGTLAIDLDNPLIGAKLIYAQGRTLHRADKTDQACAYFEKSAALAESLGVDGYEIHVLSLGLAGWGYSMSRRFAEAENTFARLIALTESRGDMLNLTMALSNRCIVSMLSFKTERMLEDLRRVIAISRETGFPLIECTSSKDLGEVYHCLGQEVEAEAQARQAISVAQQVTGRRSSQAVIAQLLLARVLVYRGRVAEGNEVLAEIGALQAEARAAGEIGLEWSPADQLLSDSVKLVIDGAPDVEWERLLARAQEIMMQPQDLVEMMELRVLACARTQRVSEARHFWQLAINEATRNAEISLGRLRKLEPLLAVSSAVA